jgi:hypothetical protein
MHPQPGGQKRVEVLTSGSHHEFTGKHPAFPHAMVLTGSFVLSPVIRIWLTPSSADNSTDLTPTARRQDHTTSPSASGVLVSNTIRVHRILSRVRDDRERPLSGTGRNGYATDLGIL